MKPTRWHLELAPSHAVKRAGSGASGTLKDFARELEACPTRQAAASLLADYDSLVPAVDAMVETFQSVLERLDQATRILCLRCQHHNPPLSRSCENCHAQLPRMDGFVSQSSFAVLEGGAEMPITEELHELFTAVNQVVEQKIDFEEFLVVVEAMKQFVNDQEQQVRARAQKELDRRRKCRVSDAPENEVLSFLEHGLDVITQGFDMIWTGLELIRPIRPAARNEICPTTGRSTSAPCGARANPGTQS
ncbi:hypothetical protein DYH09_19030 [bacterium CPR1]|nr:hypothetical protein [bacterium CPR1]